MIVSPEKEAKYVSWTWIVGVLLGLLLLIGGFTLNDNRASIGKLQDNKLDRAEYIKDFEQQQLGIARINQKLDDLPEMIIKQIRRANAGNHRILNGVK